MQATHNPPTPAADRPSPAEILRGAACYLRRHGWTQHTYFSGPTDNPTPPACLLGALAMATFGHRFPDNPYDQPEWIDYKRAEQALIDYLALNSSPDDEWPEPELGEWNDQPARTADQVITALEQAAAWVDHTRARAVAA